MSLEKRFGQALIMEGGIQSAEEALAGQDARILWISVALTGGMFLKTGPKLCGMTKYRKGPQMTHKGALRAKLQEIGTN